MNMLGRGMAYAAAMLVLLVVQPLCSAAVAAAQFKPAKPIVMVTPPYPTSARYSGREGWVLLSFVVTTEGTVRDVFVEDSSGLESFERAALAAVREFRYEPASFAGTPVEQAWTRFKITFQFYEPSTGATSPFVAQFRRLSRHLRNDELDRAREQLERMRARPRLNLYEDAWYWWGSALLHGRTGNKTEQRKSLLRAVAYEEMYLPPDMYLRALHMLYADYANSGEYSAALDMFERIRRVDEDGALVADLQNSADRMAAVLEGAQALSVSAIISSARPWAHDLSRNGFELHNVVGRIYHLDMRCEQRAQEIAYEPERAWNIPASWGACRLYVHGEEGTSFTLVEYEA